MSISRKENCPEEEEEEEEEETAVMLTAGKQTAGTWSMEKFYKSPSFPLTLTLTLTPSIRIFLLLLLFFFLPSFFYPLWGPPLPLMGPTNF